VDTGGEDSVATQWRRSCRRIGGQVRLLDEPVEDLGELLRVVRAAVLPREDTTRVDVRPVLLRLLAVLLLPLRTLRVLASPPEEQELVSLAVEPDGAGAAVALGGVLPDVIGLWSASSRGASALDRWIGQIHEEVAERGQEDLRIGPVRWAVMRKFAAQEEQGTITEKHRDSAGRVARVLAAVPEQLRGRHTAQLGMDVERPRAAIQQDKDGERADPLVDVEADEVATPIHEV
jgi:hypothetical protein